MHIIYIKKSYIVYHLYVCNIKYIAKAIQNKTAPIYTFYNTRISCCSTLI